MKLNQHSAYRLRLIMSASSLFLVPLSISAQSIAQSGRSDQGMVSAAQPLATDAGVRILEMGGNAAAAAVAASSRTPIPVISSSMVDDGAASERPSGLDIINARTSAVGAVLLPVAS